MKNEANEANEAFDGWGGWERRRWPRHVPEPPPAKRRNGSCPPFSGRSPAGAGHFGRISANQAEDV